MANENIFFSEHPEADSSQPKKVKIMLNDRNYFFFYKNNFILVMSKKKYFLPQTKS